MEFLNINESTTLLKSYEGGDSLTLIIGHVETNFF